MNTNNRRLAIQWWNTLTLQQKQQLTKEHDHVLLVSGKPHYFLAGSEIEKIWSHCIETVN